mmetsp:Transcript_73009/g.144718  ORF Transcript_73009/g.144718 Transcript_73009/m.144718 type:complete len:306 (-) Transcript_73009:111-1028(-)|eukprot:CAMPEP_0172662308 /NCGR_PEP_ID=MMETSP1074-20121228/5286_1 /TAXON_ID=2916 /ORGANISM="Ceratium fusus, Strain PA161109" /LENGTH=305 /DNA_ID=CAMNT_0013478211 /DNA_START=72 /DNA_END=989 /DNA_ORIENTATION=+
MSTDDHHGCSTSRSVLPPTLLERGDGSGEVRLRVARNSQPDSEASCADHSRGGSPINQGGVLRKKLYDQNVADWSARYKKNKQTLENLKQDCEVLRSDVAKQQQEVDERAETFRQLDDRYSNEVVGRAADAKESYESAVHLRGQLQVQLSEYRKTKTHLVREKKFLTADYERKHSELMRTAEARDKLDTQLAQLAAQLGQVSAERRRMERELDFVQHSLRANTELADEVNNEIEHVFRSVKDAGSVQKLRTEESSICCTDGFGSPKGSVQVFDEPITGLAASVSEDAGRHDVPRECGGMAASPAR